MVPFEFQRRPANPLQVSCMSKGSRCGALRISTSSGKPSAGFVRVEALSLWQRANFNVVRQTLCGSRACRSTLVVAPFEFQRRPANPLQVSCMSKGSRCGALRISTSSSKPSAGFVRVEALSLWQRANFNVVRRTSAGLVHVEALSLWQRANFNVVRRTSAGLVHVETLSLCVGGCLRWRVASANSIWNRRPSLFSACGNACARSVLRIFSVSTDDPLAVLGGWWHWRVERPTIFFRNR